MDQVLILTVQLLEVSIDLMIQKNTFCFGEYNYNNTFLVINSICIYDFIPALGVVHVRHAWCEQCPSDDGSPHPGPRSSP